MLEGGARIPNLAIQRQPSITRNGKKEKRIYGKTNVYARSLYKIQSAKKATSKQSCALRSLVIRHDFFKKVALSFRALNFFLFVIP